MYGLMDDLARANKRIAALERRNAELAEALGGACDRLDNLVAALKMQLPDRIHMEGIRGTLPEIATAARVALAENERTAREHTPSNRP